MTNEQSVDPKRYIDLPERTKPILDGLHHAVARKRICTLIGPSGSGKSALINYWHNMSTTSENTPYRIILVRLRPAQNIPMICVLYPRIWYEIRRLQRPAYLPHKSGDEPSIKITTERDAQLLHLRVIEQIERLRLQAIIIDNAHLLDQQALEWILDLRTYYDEEYGFLERRALILVGQAKEEEIRTNRLVKALAKNDELNEAWTEKLELHKLQGREMGSILLSLMMENLDASFAADVKLQTEAEEINKLCQGNWYHIARFGEILDQELGSSSAGKQRSITSQVLNKVKQRYIS